MMRPESAPCLDPAGNYRSLDVTVIAEKSFRTLNRAVDYDVVLCRQNAIDVDRCILVCRVQLGVRFQVQILVKLLQIYLFAAFYTHFFTSYLIPPSSSSEVIAWAYFLSCSTPPIESSA